MELTPKQEKFAQCVADGMSQADAYRSAFSTANMKDTTIYVRASELMADSKVSVRVAFLREQLSAKALWTREDSVNTLKQVLADESARPSDKTGAVKVLNEMHGYNAPTKIDISGGLTITELKQTIIDPKA